MTKDIYEVIYLFFYRRLIFRAIDRNLGVNLIQGQLDEARHQLELAAIKYEKGFSREL